MMYWHIVSSQVYHSGTPREGHMYFLSDTREIYRGSEPFTESAILYTELPTTSIAINRLYINSETLEGRIYNGSSWKTVIKPVVDEVTIDGENPVSAKAIAAYVAQAIQNVTGSGDVVTGVAWDGENHILTVTKGGSASANLTINGVAVDLSYNSETGELQLTDTDGNAIGTAINLGLEKFVKSGIYDDENRSIVLYFDDEKTESITIPVGDLVDTYTAEGSGALTLTVENNIIKGSIKISTADGNQLRDENGLYVPPVDISGKMDKAADAVDGDIAVLDAEGNVVDSGKKFEDLVPNNVVYEGATLEDAITGHTPIKGDIAIVSTPIGATGKVQKTVHQFDGEQWKAFDSDYDASKIILPADWITTTKIGVHQTLTNGQATIAPAGTDVATALNQLTAKEDTDPDVTQPAVSFSSSSDNEFKAYEVGTEVAVAVTAALSAGTYQYGRMNSEGKFENSTSAGIIPKSWIISDTDGAEHTDGNTADFGTIEVGDDTNYKVTAKAEYDGSAYTPASNFKRACSKAGIAAGSKSKTTAAITGYRNCFYGTFTSKADLTSALIRSLTKTNAAVSKGTSFNMPIPVGTLRAVIAYPVDATEVTTLTSVKDANASDAQINTAFTLQQLDVEGANGYTAKAYKVFVKDWADPVTAANTYKVEL